MREDIKRKLDESFLDYAERILVGKKSGLYDIDYTEMYELLFGVSISSCEARKRSYLLRDLVDKLRDEEINDVQDKTELQKIRDKIGEFDIKKRQFQVERNGLNKIKRELIPAITVAEELAEIMDNQNMQVNIPDYCFSRVKDTDNEYEMILHITDFHIGYIISNCKGNHFNWIVANQRIDKLIEEVYKYVKLYNITKINVVNTGDVIEHNYMRKNQSQFCEFSQAEQINKAIEIIYRLLVALCGMHCNVDYTSIAGNHDRSSGDNKANLQGDNADIIIARQLLKYNEISENKRLRVIENDPLADEIILEVNGTKHKFIHGDGKFKDGEKLIKSEMAMDDDAYSLWRGHYHNFNIQSENNGRYIISTGCLSGYNDYSTNFGCKTWASQTIGIIGDGKVELIKDVHLQ